MIRNRSPPTRPWYVVPADHNHVDWVVVSAAIVNPAEKLKLDYPKIEGNELCAN